MITADYYKMYDYVSNSQLGAFDEATRMKLKPENIQEIYDFGNLFDAIVTEEEKFDFENNIMTDQKRKVLFEEYLVEKAKLMKEAVLDDKMFQLILNNSKKQHVILRKAHEFQWCGIKFKLPLRIKMDLYISGNLVVDLKSTACTSYKQFVASISHFNYDRQGAFYIDVAKVDKILYVGVSKKKNKKTGNHDVYKYMIERDSEVYLSGLQKYTSIAFRYWSCIWNFPLSIPLPI